MRKPLITNDAIVLGMLLILLTLIFRTAKSSRPFWQRLDAYVGLGTYGGLISAWLMRLTF